MRMSKGKIGAYVYVEFYDHASGYPRAVFCRVSGWLLSYNDREIVIRTWDTPYTPDCNTRDEEHTILRSTIVRIEELPDLRRPHTADTNGANPHAARP